MFKCWPYLFHTHIQYWSDHLLPHLILHSVFFCVFGFDSLNPSRMPIVVAYSLPLSSILQTIRSTLIYGTHRCVLLWMNASVGHNTRATNKRNRDSLRSSSWWATRKNKNHWKPNQIMSEWKNEWKQSEQ